MYVTLSDRWLITILASTNVAFKHSILLAGTLLTLKWCHVKTHKTKIITTYLIQDVFSWSYVIT